MGFVKVAKSNAYFKRFQVKPRRRRQNKTDYFARKRLIWQDKNKYSTPKYRLVVRFTNRDVIAAIIASDIGGDRVINVAYGHELQRYGVKFGFNSWAATYAVGLLLARRVNAHFKLPFQGCATAYDYYYNLGDEEFPGEDDSETTTKQRPVKAVLDVGIHRTTTGARIFAAVKGACDGGINVPHSETRFPGAPTEGGDDAEVDFEVVRKYIFAGHIAEYMNALAEEDEESFGLQFAVAKKEGISGDDLEGLWTEVHKQIREETPENLLKPVRAENQLGYFKTRSEPKTIVKKVYKKAKLSKEQRVARVIARVNLRDYRLAQRAQQQ